jgi:hypothetical protein
MLFTHTYNVSGNAAAQSNRDTCFKSPYLSSLPLIDMIFHSHTHKLLVFEMYQSVLSLQARGV